MSKEYVIRRLPDGLGRYELNGEFKPEELSGAYANLVEVKLDSFPWDVNGYKPDCRARMGWNAQGLHILMYANEPTIRAEETEVGGFVCCDSCLEFFLMPKEGNPLYFNCEVSPVPVYHLGVGEGRHGRMVYKFMPEGMELVSSKHEGAWWAVSYTIPAAFLQNHFGLTLASGQKMRGNFYKCADKHEKPHYGMYVPYDVPRPDYHRPERFTDFVTE